jgi:PEP-CTERM motif
MHMKYFGLAAAALMMTIGASASSITVSCSVAGANGANSFATAALSCAQLTTAELGSNTLNSVTIQLEDSFDQGTGAQTNIFDFNYTAIDPDVALGLGTPPNTCITVGTGVATSCQDTVSGTIIGGTEYQLGNVITTDLAAYVGAGNFTVANVSANPDSTAPGSSLTASGQLGSTAFVTYTYSTPSGSAPEPGSMMLLGSGLLAAGLIGRKTLARK